MPILKKDRTQKHPHTRETCATPSLLGVWKRAALTLPIALGIGLLLLLPCTALLLTFPDPGRYVAPVGTALFCLIAALYGALVTRFSRGKVPLLCGVFSAVTLIALLLLLSLVVPKAAAAYTPPVTAGLYGVTALCTVGGALLRPQKKQRRKRRR